MNGAHGASGRTGLASGTLLHGGLRLSLLLAPRRTVLDAGVGAFLLATLALAVLGFAWQWMLFQPPRIVNTFGVQTFLVQTLLQLLAAAALCAVCARRRLLWSVAALLQFAQLLPSAVLALASAFGDPDNMLSPWVIGALALWTAAIHLRLAWALAGAQRWRAPLAALLSVAVVLLPWLGMHAQYLWTTDWRALHEQMSEDDEVSEPGMLDDPEAVMYTLDERIDAATAALAPQRPGTIDMYVLAFGGDASENVFRNEVDYIERLFPQRFDAGGRVLALLNHPDSVATRPLATATNLERGLAAIGTRMDPVEDILFLYLTSHGSAEHELYVNQPPLPLDQVTPDRLRAALDASGIRWRVLVVSACYSGGFIDALRDPQTLVITAASADRTSFGCGSESDITWFGHAFIAEALNATTDLREAYDLSVKTIAQREQEQEFEPSNPQWDAGERIEAQLRLWREQLVVGEPLPFVPPEAAEDGDDGDDGDTAAGDAARAKTVPLPKG